MTTNPQSAAGVVTAAVFELIALLPPGDVMELATRLVAWADEQHHGHHGVLSAEVGSFE